MASRTAPRSSRSSASHRTDGPAGRGAPPGRCQATIATSSPARSSSRWLPAKPPAPVTRIVAGMDAMLPGHAAERAVERREVPQPGEREAHEEAVVRCDRCVAERTPIHRLILERDAAALRVVEPRQTLLQNVL